MQRLAQYLPDWQRIAALGTRLVPAGLVLIGSGVRAQNVEFREISEPEGVVNRTTYPLLGDPVASVTAPAVDSVYRFVFWTLDGIRVNDAAGHGANPFVFTINQPAEAVAHYLHEAEDSDLDGLPDWFEVYYFANLEQAVDDDPDGDGFTNEAERQLGQHPNLRDERAQGGVSRRRLPFPLTVHVGNSDASLVYGGISGRRSVRVTPILNGDFVTLAETSTPAGVFQHERVVARDLTVALHIAPETFNGYRYTGWFVDGLRLDTPPESQPIPITVGHDVLAEARYVEERLDSDGDGIPDWIELNSFDSLENTLDSDPDEDGIPWGVEQFRDYSVAVKDALNPGGISRRRSAPAEVDTTGRVDYQLLSKPLGIISESRRVDPGSVVTTPDLSNNTHADYRFVYWEIDGVRQIDDAGYSLGQVTFEVDAPIVATAHYVDQNVDSDSDGFQDWYEWMHFGTLDHGGADDSDNDGLTLTREVFRDFSPLARDHLAPGGMSRRRSALAGVNFVQADAPPFITVNAPSNVTPVSARLSGILSGLGGLGTEYHFEHGLTPAYGSVTPIEAISAGGFREVISADITGLFPATVYHFRIIASNSNGDATSADYTFSTLWDARTPEGFEEQEVASRWQTTGVAWEIGAPGSGPGSAFAGLQCAATSLSGDYLPGTDSWFISPVFEVPLVSEFPHLRFDHWWSFGAGDDGAVEIRQDTTGPWRTIATFTGSHTEWMEKSLDLSAFAGRNVQVAFRMSSDMDTDVGPGWFLDDVRLVTGEIDGWLTNTPTGFATDEFWRDWTVTGAVWDSGQPSSGPGTAFEGDTCAATNLSGNYPADSETRLVSPFFQAPSVEDSPRLRFWHWFNLGSGEVISIEVRELGGSWREIESYSGGGSGAWSLRTISLSDVAGQWAQVAFRLRTDGWSESDGWYIDEAQILTGPEVMNNPETFDSGVGDWTGDLAGIWQIGRPVVGPGAARSGANVAATILADNYPRSAVARFESPPFEVGDPGPGWLVTLNFWSWHQFGAGDNGELQVAVSNGENWSEWQAIREFSGESAGWQQETFNISDYKGATIRLGFLSSADSDSLTGAGWYIDDVELSALVLSTLEVNETAAAVLPATTSRQYYAIDVEEGTPLYVNLDVTSGTAGAGIYVRRGELPTLSGYDHRAAAPDTENRQIFVPFASPGRWYVMVHGAAVGNPASYTISTQSVDAAVVGVSPSSAWVAVDNQLRVSGAGFAAGTTVSLFDGAGNVSLAHGVEVDSFTAITATFAAGSIPAGTYSLRVAVPGTAPVELADAMTFTPNQGGVLETEVIVPSSVGRHAVATIWVEYRNVGDTAMPAPLLEVYGLQGGTKKAILTPDQSRLSSGFWTSAVPEGFSTSVQFLASGETPGLLQPGETLRRPIYYVGLQQPWDFSEREVLFRVDALKPNSTIPADWSLLKDGMRPTYIRADAWDAIWSNFVAQVGSAWGSYLAAIDQNAVYLSQIGVHMEEIEPLLSFELRQADALSPIHTLASATDAAVAGPGLGLRFSRFYPQPISRRYELGPLGRGWKHEWQWSLRKESDGTVRIIDPSDTPEIFQPDSREPDRFIAVHEGGRSLRPLTPDDYELKALDGTIMVFDVGGTLEYIEDTNGNRITCGYSGGNLTSLTHNRSGQSIALGYNGHGRISTITDSQGRQTNLSYDASGEHLIQVETYDGRITSYDYVTAQGTTREHALQEIALPGGSHRYFTYDARGRIASTHADGNAGIVTFSYDSAGTVTAADALGNSSKFYFDNYGQILKRVDPLGRSLLVELDDERNVRSVTDSAGRSYDYDYDQRGNVIRFTDPLGQATRFSYTSDLNRLATLTDAKSNVTRYAYDTRGNLESITYPDDSIESWTTNAAGHPTQWVNRRGRAIDITWDNLGLPTRKTYQDGTHVDYNYDAQGNLETTVDSTGTTIYTYDTDEFLTRIDYPESRWLEFTYDLSGRRATSLNHLGHQLTYHYDTPGRLSHIVDEASVEIVRYTYDAVGRLSRKDLGNGVYTTYDYDPAGQLLHLINHKPDTTVLSRFDYTYDLRGRRTSMGTIYGAWTYGYDEIGQLTSAVFASTNPEIPDEDLTYVYDALGNRIRTVENGVTTEYTTNNMNQYVRAGDTTFEFDADGNLEREISPAGTTVYSYDDENRLIAVTDARSNRTYAYDALGQKAEATENGSATRFVIDPAAPRHAVTEYSGTGALLARNDFGADLVSRTLSDGTIAYCSSSAQGNVAELTDSNGEPLTRYLFTPFGEDLREFSSVSNPFQFSGSFGVRSATTTLASMGARYYNASLGRFTSPDPVGRHGDDFNVYRYVANEPTMLVDPAGLRATCKYGYSGIPIPAHRYVVTQDGWEYHFGPPSLKDLFIGRGERFRVRERKDGTYDYEHLGYQYYCYADFVNNCWGQSGRDYEKYCAPSQDPASTPEPTTEPGGEGSSGTSTSTDPNELLGPAGFGPENYLRTDNLLAYRVNFENDPSATAPAQQVEITNPLPAAIDGTSFTLSSVGFGERFFPIPPGTRNWEHIEAVTCDGVDFEVHIDVGIDANGEVYANFRSVNPETDLPPPVNIGFLPPEPPYDPADPNDPVRGRGQGRGFVSYTVRAEPGTPSGTELRNIAYIVFDGQPAIATNQRDPHDPSLGTDAEKEALVTIDGDPPSSAVEPLPPESGRSLSVVWSGADIGSGIVAFDLEVATDGGPWEPWLAKVSATDGVFQGELGREYAFRSRAWDGVGYVEAWPELADTQTSVTQAGNRSPTIQPVPDQSVPVGAQLTLPLVANDPDPGQQLEFELTTSPDGMAIDTDGIISWTPREDQTGPWEVQVRATDDGEPPLSASTRFEVTATRFNAAWTWDGVTLELRFPTRENHRYRVEVTDDLGSGVWAPANDDLIGDGESAAVHVTIGRETPQRFFRILELK